MRVGRRLFQARDERGEEFFVHRLVGILHVGGPVEGQEHAVCPELRGGVYGLACEFHRAGRAVKRVGVHARRRSRGYLHAGLRHRLFVFGDLRFREKFALGLGRRRGDLYAVEPREFGGPERPGVADSPERPVADAERIGFLFPAGAEEV